MRSRRRPRRAVLLSLLAGGAAMLSCQKGGVIGGCQSPADCPPELLCIRSICAVACNRDADCPRRSQTCDAGACEEVAEAECADDSTCAAGSFCLWGGKCTARLADGESCAGIGDSACASSHCAAGVCCGAGDCCATAADCPASYAAAPRCDDTSGATLCQGRRQEVACTDHVCTAVVVDDDTACAGRSHDCPGHLAPVACTAAADQVVAQCPAACAATPDCDSGYVCSPPACVPPRGTGEACVGLGQGTCSDGLKCEHDVCCGATGAGCCRSAADCARGLACDSALASCRVVCNDYDSAACAAPLTTYCKTDACVPKLAVGQPCVSPGECLDQACECADAACSVRRCAASACGTCEHLDAGFACIAGLGAPAPRDDPNGCSGERSCYAGECKLDVGRPCSAAGECGFDHCECGDVTCSANGKKCSAEACEPCHFTSSGATCDGTMDAGEDCDDLQACTHTDRCDAAGACAGTLITCVSLPGICGLKRTCNGTSTCSEAYPTGDCNDFDGCTDGEHCDGAGVCLTGTLIPAGGGACVVRNSKTSKSCTTMCSERSRACVSIGNDAAGTDTYYRYYRESSDNCVAAVGACDSVMGYNPLSGTYNCNGAQLDWTNCRCQ
ncbi:MAG: hypothetical protein HY903_20315 [Deltaproteobacteria bacterium]|nr:hypothetical protein [Deltaproteobacteria bacterium]